MTERERVEAELARVQAELAELRARRIKLSREDMSYEKKSRHRPDEPLSRQQSEIRSRPTGD